MHRNVDQDESKPGREIDCWNSNRIYRRSQALFTSAGLIVRSIQGLDLAPILHKLPRGSPSCQLWLLRFVCLVVCVFFMYGIMYNRYVILLPTQIITGFIRFFYTKEERGDYTTTEFYNIYTKYTAFDSMLPTQLQT